MVVCQARAGSEGMESTAKRKGEKKSSKVQLGSKL